MKKILSFITDFLVKIIQVSLVVIAVGIFLLILALPPSLAIYYDNGLYLLLYVLVVAGVLTIREYV